MTTSKASDSSLFNEKTNTSSQQQQLQLIDDLKHIIHYIAVFLRILQWKEPEKVYSFTSLCALFLHSTLYRFFLYSAPALFAILKIYNYHNQEINNQTRRHLASSQFSLINDLSEIRDKIQWMIAITNWLQQESDTVYRVYYKKYLSISSAWQRSKICLAVSCLFMLFYAGWLILLQQIDLTFIVCCSLQVVMCVYYLWSHLIQTACVRAASTTATTHIKAPIIDNDKLGERYITVYCFEIYHNQRWWFHKGWSNRLLPQDRPVWSDKHSEATPSIHDFQLPPAVSIGKPNERNQQKIASWTWLDPNWFKRHDINIDSDGWQYGNWQWKKWSPRSSGLGVCTRRQKWCRYAQRVESWIDAAPAESQEESKCGSSFVLVEDDDSSISSAPSSIFDDAAPTESQEKSKCGSSVVLVEDDYSSVSSASSSIFDESASNSSTTISISYITANSPTLSSLNNKGQRMLHRYSENLYNKGVSFMNMTTPELCSNSPSADDTYKSPKPQKFKRFGI